MRRVSIAFIVAVASGLIGSTTAAHADPPPPPATPTCKYCSGPPPAPTPVPTLAAAVVAPDSRMVGFELSPTKVHRGGRAQVAVIAKQDDKVTMVIRYYRAKPSTYRARVGKSGKLVKRWTVPKTAPIGKATIRVSVSGQSKPYSAVLSFTVTK